MSNLRGFEDLIECPYNKSHQILRSRIQTHLVKCRKVNPDVQKETCPFNNTHLVNKQELALHIEICPSRASFERYRYNITSHAETAKEANTASGSSGATFTPVAHCEESWDDFNEPSYDPQKYVQNAAVLRTLNCESKAKRNAFREKERKRLNNLN